jgi:HSP20 family protein
MAAMKETTVPQKVDQKAPDTREEERTLVPPVDIFETADGLAVVADLPGVSKEDVEIHVDNNLLTMKGKAKSVLSGDPLAREYQLRNFFRQFELSDKVDRDNIRAEMKFGVLSVFLPKVKEQIPKKITVNVA